MSSRRANNVNNNNENDYPNNKHIINNNGVGVNVRYIPRVGHSKPVPPRGQRTHNPSLNAHFYIEVFRI